MAFGVEIQELQDLVRNLITDSTVNARPVTYRRPSRNNTYSPADSAASPSFQTVDVVAFRGNIPQKRTAEQGGQQASADIYYLIPLNDVRFSGVAVVPTTADEIIDEGVLLRVVKVKRDARDAYWRLDCITVDPEAPVP